MTILSRIQEGDLLTFECLPDTINPVVASAEFVLETLDLVQINEDGVAAAARYIGSRFIKDGYTPRTWRTHPLHLCPPEPYDPTHPGTRATLDWIFLISSLNFSFWSYLDGSDACFGVEWREGWASERHVVHTGYWSLVAALDRALEEGIPITDPAFYASEERCPNSLIEHVFRASSNAIESVPLLPKRIAIMREVGAIICAEFGGSFQGFVEAFQRRYNYDGTALQFAQMVTDTFPSFRDEHWFEGRRIFFWKRAQILTAETWAAFFPPSEDDPHPLFPHGIGQLTMFADYRVPQILHHLRLLTYAPSLVRSLKSREEFECGVREEIAIRAASIVAVERVAAALRVDGRHAGG
ncbi:hypothetical protein B0F90DRAFT_361638 [Multifurca ochricompacta]|uniref:Queuosine 5'-phosphate N-glycosylase/hydrolase n=1 Tax=Multifurca ochricompacta TaxID=376703 RepID=A0AAD4M6E4_9AGAM|nr:hypothetical protein B0F90DRAFT_361638 [Multifurca ochricompacta]